MNVSLIDVDSKMPNLALMKLSAWHKANGDSVEWFDPLWSRPDRVYASKVFTYTNDYPYMPDGVVCGGTGYWCYDSLTDAVEHICPDYALYGINHSIGFLTRGCSRKCEHCIVPEKEGAIRANADITEFCRHGDVVLLDNNVLAHEHGVAQIAKMAKLGLRVDFNQGIDARLVTPDIARLLAKVRWLHPVRLACDRQGQKAAVGLAVGLLRAAGVTPRAYSCYMLVKDVPESHDRSEFLRGLGVDPFAQPYRDPHTCAEPTQEQRDFARWVNHKAVWKTVPWEKYRAAAGAAHVCAQKTLDIHAAFDTLPVRQ